MADAATAPCVSIMPVLTVNFIGALGYSIILPFLIYMVAGCTGLASSLLSAP